MPSQEDINTQLRLLAVYRSTLAHLLEQQARHGLSYVPPAIVSDISETRTNIQKIKHALHEWSVHVDDLPSDGSLPSGHLTWIDLGHLRATPIRSDANWRLVVENDTDQDVISIAITLRPSQLLFVSQTKFSIPRIVARGKIETQPFTIVDPNVVPSSITPNTSQRASAVRRTRLEQQCDQLNKRIEQIDADITRLEAQNRYETGLARLRGENEIRQIRDDRQRAEEELQSVEIQLEQCSSTAPFDPSTPTYNSPHQPSAPQQLPVLVSYTILGQNMQRATGEFFLQLA